MFELINEKWEINLEDKSGKGLDINRKCKSLVDIQRAKGDWKGEMVNFVVSLSHCFEPPPPNLFRKMSLLVDE